MFCNVKFAVVNHSFTLKGQIRLSMSINPSGKRDLRGRCASR